MLSFFTNLFIILWPNRSSTTQEELGEMTKTNNPEEINIDDDAETDEDETIEGVCVVLLIWFLWFTNKR